MSKIKKYNATTEQWETIDNGVVDAVKSNTTDRMTVSEEEPENPKKGDVWVNTADPLIPDRSIAGDKIALNTIKSENVDWTTHSSYSIRNPSQFTISSTTMTNKGGTITLPKGRYAFIYNLICSNGDAGANGEVNVRMRMGSAYSAIITGFLPNLAWSSVTVSDTFIADISNDNTIVQLQTSVNWPARGTYFVQANMSSIVAIRVG